MINTNLKLVRSQVDQMMVNLDKGSRAARDEMMVAMIQLAKEEIKGERPYTTTKQGTLSMKSAKAGYLFAGFHSAESFRNFGGAKEAFGKKGGTRYYEKAIPGEPPMNRTGNLRRSISGVKSNNGFASYSAIVGPGMEYARAVEAGGIYAPPSWRGTSAMQGFPYMRPAYLKFREIYPAILKKHIGEGI